MTAVYTTFIITNNTSKYIIIRYILITYYTFFHLLVLNYVAYYIFKFNFYFNIFTL